MTSCLFTLLLDTVSVVPTFLYHVSNWLHVGKSISIVMQRPARKITTFSAGMAHAGARAPRVTRCMHIMDRSPALPASSRPPLSREAIADKDSFAGHHQAPARKITTFSAGMTLAGARAPRVTRCMHIMDRSPALTAISRPPLSREAIADIDSFARFNIFLDQGSDSNANLRSKRQATKQDFVLCSVKKLRPSFEDGDNVIDAFQVTSAESWTPEIVHMNVGDYFASKSQSM